MNQVTLVDLRFISSGAYRCEVSTEGPNFETLFSNENMTVRGECLEGQRRQLWGEHAAKKKREKIAAAPRVKLKKDEERDARRIQRSLCLPGVCDERASRIKNQA